MQVTEKNGVQVKIKKKTISEYGDEFIRCFISNKTYNGEIILRDEEVTLVYAEGKEGHLIIAMNPENTIIDCEAWDWENPIMGDYHEALLAISKRHNLNS